MGYIDNNGLSRLWTKIKDYVANNAVTPTNITGNAGTATKWQTARTIEGITIDGSVDRTHYGTCSTVSATVAKTVSITGFTLATGARITVRFTYCITVSGATLNVTSTGAKSIYYKGAVLPAGYVQTNALVTLIYDGTYWRVVGDLVQSQVDDLETSVATLEASKINIVQYAIPVSSIAVGGGITIATSLPNGGDIINVNIYCNGANHPLMYSGFSGATTICIRNVGTGAYTPPTNSKVYISYI